MKREDYIRDVHTLVDSRKLSEAIALSDQYTTAYPADPEGWRYRAYVFEVAKAISQAIDAMSEAIRLSPREPGYRWLRGMYRLLVGLNELAEQDMTMTLQLSEEGGSSYYEEMARLLRAEAYKRLGQPAKARADCEQVGDDPFLLLDQRISKKTILDSLP